RHGRTDRAVVDGHVGHVDRSRGHTGNRIGPDEADRPVQGACFLNRPGQGVPARRGSVDADDDGLGLTDRCAVRVLRAVLLTHRKLLVSKRTSLEPTLEHKRSEHLPYVTSLSESGQSPDNTRAHLGRCPYRSETMPAASGGVRVLEERPPLLDGLVDSAHPQLPEPGLLGPEVELPAELGQGAVALAVIALPAAGDEVLPTVDSPTRARNHMVDRRGGLAAVG